MLGACALGILLLGCTQSAADKEKEQKVLNIYSWSDYIGETTIQDFEKETRERREEIARMLSGAEVTDEARAQASRLLVA